MEGKGGEGGEEGCERGEEGGGGGGEGGDLASGGVSYARLPTRGCASRGYVGREKLVSAQKRGVDSGRSAPSWSTGVPRS